MGPSTVTHAWIRLTRRLGIEGIKLHDCRHSHASILLGAGVHPKVVQERLGHSSISVTMALDSHVMPMLREEAVAEFEAAFTVRAKEPVATDGDTS